MRSWISAEDLTTRATIRNVATRLFAERGFDAVTVRQIASEAGVSPGLVLHHFGSKAGLQAAVVERVQDWFDQMLNLTEGDAAMEAMTSHQWGELLDEASSVFNGEHTLPDLLGRLVADNDPVVTSLFSRIADRSEKVIERYVAQGVIADDPDPRARAALLTASDLGSLLLRRQLITHLGFDPYHGEGMQRWADVATRVYAALFTAPTTPQAINTEE